MLVALRLMVIALLILCATGLEVAKAVPDLTVVFAADRSDSIRNEDAGRVRNFLDEVRRQAGPAHKVGLVTFGADAILEEAPTIQPRLALASRPRTDGTNIAAAIERSLTAIPEGVAGRIVLLTDGQATAGDLGPALAAVRARAVELAVVPFGSAPAPEVMVEDVSMPAAVSVGERLPVTITLRATAESHGELRVRANGTLLLARELSLRPGRTHIDLETLTTEPGLLRVEAAIDATPDTEQGNNRAFALAFVHGPPSILYVGDPPGPLGATLSAQGLSVRRIRPSGLPASVMGFQGIAAVVLDDVPASLLAPRQMAALRDYVRMAGGGLVAIGGSRSFGIGGYAGTLLEEVLPVGMDVRHRLVIPSMAIVLVIDASGSMSGLGAEISPIDLAKETAQSAIDLLDERDLVGVVAFDQSPHWLVKPTPASQRAHIMDAVSRIRAGGGTNMYPALATAQDALHQVEAKVKHAIVLSDGMTDPGDFRRLVTGMAEERITVSTVAIGRDLDLEIMRHIAVWGRGRSYVARDSYRIPQIITAEAMLATRATVIEERFIPRVVGVPEVLGDLGPIPPLLGYLATSPKPAAEVPIVSHQQDPILATWTYGLGRAAAITTDARNRWTSEWTRWPRAARFWSQVVRWVMSRETGPLDMHVRVESDHVRIVLDARSTDGSPVVSWTAQAITTGDQGEISRVSLSQTRPGWYEAVTPLPPAGAYMVTIVAEDGGRPAGRGSLPLAVSYSPELRQIGLNRVLISHLVEAVDARVITTPAEALAPPGAPRRQHQPVWPLLAGMAVSGFVVELAVRRIPAIEYAAGQLLGMTLAFIRRTPSSREVAEDAEYAAADRWRIEDPAEAAARAASMQAAARLYVARLRRERSNENQSARSGH